MNISSLRTLCLIVIASCAATNASAAPATLTLVGKTLTLQAPGKCAARPHPSGRELARYLRQYDTSRDPREDIADETPWTKEEIKSAQKGLVEDGFHYPNGQDSVITWIDVDGDGFCDFTASAGIGGMKSIDRMYLFRGLPNGKFTLADSDMAYMDSVSILMPYIPIDVPGEKLPVIARNGTLMQWQAGGHQFATCETIANGARTPRQRPAPPVLTALCPHAQEIYAWATEQLPHKNELPYSSAE